MRVALTGANGHLARAFTAALTAGGDTVIGLSSSARGEQRSWRFEDVPEPRLLDGVDVLLHAAWDQAAAGAPATARINVDGSRRLIELAADLGIRVVFVSSLAAYPGTPSVYGHTKLEVEAAVTAVGGVSLRPGLVFGPGAGGMFGSLTARVASGRAIPVIRSPGGLQLVHQADLATIVVGATRQELDAAAMGGGEPPAVAHPAVHSLDAVVRAIAQAEGRRVVRVPVPWRLVHLALQAGERAGLQLPFRADSVLSLARARAACVPEAIARRLRPFDATTLSDV